MEKIISNSNNEDWISIKEKQPNIDQKIWVKNIHTQELTEKYIFKEYNPKVRPKVIVTDIEKKLDELQKAFIHIDDNILWKPFH